MQRCRITLEFSYDPNFRDEPHLWDWQSMMGPLGTTEPNVHICGTSIYDDGIDWRSCVPNQQLIKDEALELMMETASKDQDYIADIFVEYLGNDLHLQLGTISSDPGIQEEILGFKPWK